jgi:hypothetical protein
MADNALHRGVTAGRAGSLRARVRAASRARPGGGGRSQGAEERGAGLRAEVAEMMKEHSFEALRPVFGQDFLNQMAGMA